MNNQAVRTFSRLAGKSDDEIIHNIQRWLINKYKIHPLIEHLLLFDPWDYRYMGYSSNFTSEQMKGMIVKNPDIFIPEWPMIIEVDGNYSGKNIHNIKVTKTNKRNELYRKAGLKLIVLDLEEIKFLKQNLYQVLETKILSNTVVVIG